MPINSSTCYAIGCTAWAIAFAIGKIGSLSNIMCEVTTNISNNKQVIDSSRESDELDVLAVDNETKGGELDQQGTGAVGQTIAARSKIQSVRTISIKKLASFLDETIFTFGLSTILIGQALSYLNK
jgi:hypothetical protein